MRWAGLIVWLASLSCLAQPAKVDPALRQQLVQAIEAADSFDNRFDAEVWLLDMSTRLTPVLPNEKKRLKILRLVHRESRRAQLPPNWVLAVIDVESRFKQYAISRVGARGLMQIMPFWTAEIGHADDNLFDIETNLRYGCTILKYYLEMEDGNLARALARYNGSLGSRRYPDLVEQAYARRWRP